MFRLSAFHRYGIATLVLIIIVAIFWPTGDKPQEGQIAQNQPQPIVVPPPTTPDITPPPLYQQPVDSNTPTESANSELGEPQTGLPAQPEIIQEPETESAQIAPAEPVPSTTTPPPKQPSNTRPSANEWQNYQIQKGKTLAQLFRDNNLQANDAFIMARVEGSEKPLSNLSQGQKIRLKANTKGEVQLLELTTPEGKNFSFARLSDGSYYRTP